MLKSYSCTLTLHENAWFLIAECGGWHKRETVLKLVPTSSQTLVRSVRAVEQTCTDSQSEQQYL